MKYNKIIKVLFIVLITGISGSQEIKDLRSTADVDSLFSSLKGKTFMLNFWATWCPPCKKEMPDLIKLYKNYKDKGFELILVSVDDKTDKNGALKDFLTSQGIDFVTYYDALKKQEDILTHIDNNWAGEIPKTYIYDSEGKRVKALTGIQSYQTFENEIKKVLKTEE
jgi:thiol-disulfide isomerase/thioredoxin